ncbi:MAG: hypothetical protein K2X47_02815, partial [Bdellovibrionales bacterium]|nr:hypothetical protein [Bdellovibrionales bacterium]
MGTRIFQFSIILSVLIHLLMSAGVWLTRENTTPHKKENAIEFEIADVPRSKTKPENRGQIVDQSKSVNEDEPDKAKFLSEKNQKVTKETRAALTGQFKNDGGLGQASSKTPKTSRANSSSNSLPTLESLTPDYQFKAAQDDT